jgi:cytochrome c553
MRVGTVTATALALLLTAMPLAYSQGHGYGPGMTGGGMMGGGMMGGGMMGGYGPGSYGSGPGADLRSPDGRAFAATCSGCHSLPDPRQHSAQQWPSVVSRMELYIRRQGMALPPKQEVAQIESFLQRHASDAGTGGQGQR